MLTKEYKKSSIETAIRVFSLSCLFFIAGCTSTGYVRPEVTPFNPPMVSASDNLMNHPDFNKVVTASPEWVKLALKTINNLEKERLGRLYPETE